MERGSAGKEKRHLVIAARVHEVAEDILEMTLAKIGGYSRSGECRTSCKKSNGGLGGSSGGRATEGY
ncbi:hypothetical protein Pcinc_034441 [Petrolisthes cinctipes]|uniref:Uncharacterized protein n=1 Tax=Petrolisthes cinctipes TaxID=88211 RepID=A0AAE1JZZ2_PETCI|nr:hypothetical protein Pcinc_034441 [Petrolisthes cinctipes]